MRAFNDCRCGRSSVPPFNTTRGESTTASTTSRHEYTWLSARSAFGRRQAGGHQIIHMAKTKNNNLKDPISTAPDDQLAATSLGYQSYPASSSNGIFLSSVNTHRYDHFTGTDGAHNTVFSGKRKTSGRLMSPPMKKNNLLQHTGGGLGSTLVDNIVTQHIQRTRVSFPFLN